MATTKKTTKPPKRQAPTTTADHEPGAVGPTRLRVDPEFARRMIGKTCYFTGVDEDSGGTGVIVDADSLVCRIGQREEYYLAEWHEIAIFVDDILKHLPNLTTVARSAATSKN